MSSEGESAGADRSSFPPSHSAARSVYYAQDLNLTDLQGTIKKMDVAAATIRLFLEDWLQVIGRLAIQYRDS